MLDLDTVLTRKQQTAFVDALYGAIRPRFEDGERWVINDAELMPVHSLCSGENRAHSRRILDQMGLEVDQVEAALAAFEKIRGVCDCTIVGRGAPAIYAAEYAAEEQP
jgi:hypothetical protein